MNDHHATPTDDDELAVRARRDRAAFGELYRRYVTAVYRYALSRVGSRADAEDCTAQTFTEALAGIGRYKPQGHFTAWLFTIARRRTLDWLRRRPTVDLDSIPEPALETDLFAEAATAVDLGRLRALVTALPDDDRELIQLRFAAGLDFAAIGRVLGKREATAKMALYRLLERLQRAWEVDHVRTH